jgi:hypothetical protein
METQTQTQEVIKSKLVKKVSPKMIGSWWENVLTFENGVEAYYYTPEPLNKWVIGDTLTFGLEEKDGKIKLKNPQKVFEKTIGNSSFKSKGNNNPNVNIEIARQTSLKCTVELISAGKLDIKQLFECAEKMTNFIINGK